MISEGNRVFQMSSPSVVLPLLASSYQGPTVPSSLLERVAAVVLQESPSTQFVLMNFSIKDVYLFDLFHQFDTSLLLEITQL